MYFRLAGQWHDFVVRDELDRFSVTVPTDVTIELRRPNPDETAADEIRKYAQCSAIRETSPPAGFDQIVNGRIFDVTFQAFPSDSPNTQGELRNIHSQLTVATASVLNTIRWQMRELGPRDPLTDTAFGYSFDQQSWGTISHLMMPERSWSLTPELGVDGQAHYAKMIAAGETEPVSFDILRDAWAARLTSPRSALLLGVAALDLGYKGCLTRLLPDPNRILRQSGVRVKEMFDTTLPNALAGRGNLKMYAPPREYREIIRQAIEARNMIAHRFPGKPGYDAGVVSEHLEYFRLEETLLIVKDLLSLFDLYVGHSWALDSVRPETKQLIIDRYGIGLLPPPMG